MSVSRFILTGFHQRAAPHVGALIRRTSKVRMSSGSSSTHGSSLALFHSMRGCNSDGVRPSSAGEAGGAGSDTASSRSPHRPPPRTSAPTHFDLQDVEGDWLNHPYWDDDSSGGLSRVDRLGVALLDEYWPHEFVGDSAVYINKSDKGYLRGEFA